jgi:hypothetical protein
VCKASKTLSDLIITSSSVQFLHRTRAVPTSNLRWAR